MSTRVAELAVKITADGIAPVSRDLGRLDAAGKDAARGMGSLTSAMGGLRGVLAGAGVGLAISTLVTATRDLERAQAMLVGSSKLTGQSLATLQGTAADLRKSFALTAPVASELVSQVAKLATVAGKAGDIDTITRALLDLAAAQGLTAQDAVTSAGQIMAGSDEGFNRLGLPNPSQIWAAAGATTDLAKKQAEVAAVLREAAKVAGSYDARMASASGQMDLLAAKTDDLKAATAESLTPALIVATQALTRMVEWVGENGPLVAGLAAGTVGLWAFHKGLVAVEAVAAGGGIARLIPLLTNPAVLALAAGAGIGYAADRAMAPDPNPLPGVNYGPRPSGRHNNVSPAVVAAMGTPDAALLAYTQRLGIGALRSGAAAPAPARGTGGSRSRRTGGSTGGGVSDAVRFGAGAMPWDAADAVFASNQRGAGGGGPLIDPALVGESVDGVLADVERFVSEQERYQGVRDALAEGMAGSLADGIGDGIARAVATGSLSEGFQALGASMLSGLGGMIRSFGEQALVTSTLMLKLKASLASLNPAAGVAVSLAMIGLGAALQGAAQRAFGGGGGMGVSLSGGSFGGGGGNLPQIIDRGIIGGALGTPAAPVTAQRSSVTNVTIIGPNDPSAQRQMYELLTNGAARGLRIGAA